MEYIDDYESGIESFPYKRECKRVDAVKVEKVIVVEVTRGEGTPEDHADGYCCIGI